MCGSCGKRTMGTWSTFNGKSRKSAKASNVNKSSTGSAKRVVGADVVAKAKAQIALDPNSPKSRKLKQILGLLGKA